MATVYQTFLPQDGVPPGSGYATFDAVAGTNFPVPALDFDAATDEAIYFFFRASSYPPAAGGNLTAAIDWYADTATSGDVVWEAALAAITPDSDTQDIETKAFATVQTVTDSHLGTTGQRLHRASLTISNLDGLADDDWVCLRLKRLGADAADTLTGDAALTMLTLSYSDT